MFRTSCGVATRAHVTLVLGKPVQHLGSGCKAVGWLPASFDSQPADTILHRWA